MADPWLNWGWLKVGPFLGNEEDRVGYERRADELRSEEGRQRAANTRDREGIMSLGPSGRPGDYGRPVTQSKQFQDTFQDGAPPPPAVGPQQSSPVYPEAANDWSFLQSIMGAFSKEGQDAWQKARQQQSILDAQPSREQIERTKDGDMSPVPTPAPTQEAVTTGAPPPQQVAAGSAGPTLSPEQQMIEDIKRQRALIDQIYPQRPQDQNQYAAADAYADQERDRAGALAQLAFFSGITQGAGGSWEGVGRGLAGAGQAYAQGFERYQKALNNRAARAVDQQDAQYQNELGRSDAALKLYQAEQDQRKGMLSEARLAGKERRDGIDDYFKKRLDLAKGNDFTPTDQSQVDRIMRDWQISRDRGEIIETQDVRDPAAPSS